MADSKLADLTEATSLTGEEWAYVVDDPAGTPVDRKVKVATFANPSPLKGATSLGESIDRRLGSTNLTGVLSSGRLTLAAVYLPAGAVVNHARWYSGATAAASSTHVWFALYSPALALLGVTNDDTSASPWGISVVKTLDFASPITISVSGIYYIGVVVVATTVPTLRGVNVGQALNDIPPVFSGTSTTGLTTPGTAPNPAAAITTTTMLPWADVTT